MVLRLGGDLRRSGVEPARGAWVPVRRGVWLPAAQWQPLTPSQRHCARVFATAMLIDGEAVFAQAAAAAIWGLPRIEPWPTRIDVLSHRSHPRSSSGILRHAGRVCSPVDVATVRVTPVARTVIDLARWHSLETAVAASDYALRAGLCTRKELEAETSGLPARARGVRMARLVLALADPRAESPGESLSRVQMFRHGIPRPDLQVSLVDESGVFGRSDFGWGERVVGEFDGRWKYEVPPGGDAQQAAEALWREKAREDRIRRTGRRVARWVYRDAAQGHPMVTILARAGIHPVSPGTWLKAPEQNSASEQSGAS